jgi:hypothetical protein
LNKEEWRAALHSEQLNVEVDRRPFLTEEARSKERLGEHRVFGDCQLEQLLASITYKILQATAHLFGSIVASRTQWRSSQNRKWKPHTTLQAGALQSRPNLFFVHATTWGVNRPKALAVAARLAAAREFQPTRPEEYAPECLRNDNQEVLCESAKK